MRNEVRIFSLDRIKMLLQTKDPFEVPEDFSLDDFIRPSFGVFQGEPIGVKIWFGVDVSGYIKEKIWHESQKIQDLEDGSIIFEAVVAGTDEVKFWAMSWGSKAEVLEPEPLRDEIKAEAAKVSEKYTKRAKHKKPLMA
jgi:predicted DNA-binding transcriptional regulator YafY